MSNIAFEFKNVSKKKILNNISFQIEQGKSIGFVIEDDETRILFSNIISGLDCPDEGTLNICGEEPYFDGFPYQNLGVLLAEPSFINTHDGFKNLKFLSEFESSVENIQITKVMNFVGLDPLSETKVCNYSCSMYKKLSLAYALMTNAEILVINEPFKHLNPQALNDFYNIYSKLRIKNTIIYISSSEQYLAPLCDSMYRIHAAKKLATITK